MQSMDLFRKFARYNLWANHLLYDTCAKVPDAQRKEDRGAFFKSIHGTLNHLLVADLLWLGRFLGVPSGVKSPDQILYEDFAELRQARLKEDERIIAFVLALTEEDLQRPTRFYSFTLGREASYRLGHCLQHMFNHHAHHRGQVTTLLSQLGVDYGATDLLWLPGEELKT